MRKKAGITTLRARCIELTDKFAEKCTVSARFSPWFPHRDAPRRTRNPEIFREDYARCERLKNSPVYYMRRRLNGKVGKVYGVRNREYREA